MAAVGNHNIENIFDDKCSVTLKSSSSLSGDSVSAKLVEKVISGDKNILIDRTKLCLAKASLHTSTPDRLPTREVEINQIQAWVQKHLVQKYSGGMYISGSPGTGKTATVNHVLSKLKDHPFKIVKINCMNIKNQPNHVYQEIAGQLKLKFTDEETVLARLVSKRSQMVVMVLDEVDQLLTSTSASSKTMLKTIFDLPNMEGSKLILIGIANALDLSTRHLPKYFTSSNFEQASPNTKKTTPKKGKSVSSETNSEGGFLMHFTPYDKDDITLILEDRLNGNNVFDASAIKFVATKIASTSGDIRKALNACKIALETVEKQEVRQGLKVTADDGFNPGSSPKKQRLVENGGGPIGVLALSKVLTSKKGEGPIPLQQGIILLTLHKINSAAPNSKNNVEDGVQSPVPIDRVYKEHLKICEQHMFPRIDRSDLPSACGMLQDRSLVTIIERSQSASPSSSSPKPRIGTLKRGFSIKSQSSVLTGLLFDPRTIEITLRNDPTLSQKL